MVFLHGVKAVSIVHLSTFMITALSTALIFMTDNRQLHRFNYDRKMIRAKAIAVFAVAFSSKSRQIG